MKIIRITTILKLKQVKNSYTPLFNSHKYKSAAKSSQTLSACFPFLKEIYITLQIPY